MGYDQRLNIRLIILLAGDTIPAFHYHSARRTLKHRAYGKDLLFVGGHLLMANDVPLVGDAADAQERLLALEFAADGNFTLFKELPGYDRLIVALAKDRLARLKKDGVDPLQMPAGARLVRSSAREFTGEPVIKPGVEGGILFYAGAVLYTSAILSEPRNAASTACLSEEGELSVLRTPLGQTYKPKEKIDVAALTPGQRDVYAEKNAYKREWNRKRRLAAAEKRVRDADKTEEEKEIARREASAYHWVWHRAHRAAAATKYARSLAGDETEEGDDEPHLSPAAMAVEPAEPATPSPARPAATTTWVGTLWRAIRGGDDTPASEK